MSDHQPSMPPATTAAKQRLLGILLLLPFALLIAGNRLIPAAGTFIQSFNGSANWHENPEYSLDGLSRNLEALRNDQVFAHSLGNTAITLLVRLVLFLGISLGMGYLACKTPIAGSRIAAIGPALAAVLCAPVIMAQFVPLDSIHGLDSILVLDAFLTIALALAVGSLIIQTTLRHDPPGKKRRHHLIVVLGIMGLLSLGSSDHTYSLTRVLTAGGPAYSTINLPIFQQMTIFNLQKIGPGSALNSCLIFLSLATSSGIFLLARPLALQIAPLSAPVSKAGFKSLLFSLASLVLLLPLLAIATIALLQPDALSNLAMLGKAPPEIHFAILNSLPTILTIFLIQIPAAFAAAWALTWIKPFGQRGSLWIAGILFALAMIPDSTLHFSWFIFIKTAGLYDSWPAMLWPYLVCGPVFLAALLFFRSNAGATAPKGEVLRHTLLLAAGCGIAASLFAVHELNWSQISGAGLELQTMSGALFTFVNAYFVKSPLPLAISHLAQLMLIFGIPLYFLIRSIQKRWGIVRIPLDRPR